MGKIFLIISLLTLIINGNVFGDDCDDYSDMVSYGIIGENGFTYGNNSEINDNDISGSGNTPTPVGNVDTVDLNFPSLSPSSFPNFSSNNNLSDPNSVSSGTYGEIEIKKNNLTTVFSGGDYYIEELILDKDNIQFAPGRYFIEKFDMANSNKITVSPSGKVEIFIKEYIKGGNQLEINANGAVSNLAIYLYEGAEVNIGNGNQGNNETLNFNGTIYSPYDDTKIVFGNNNDIQGAILTPGEIEVGNNTYFDYGGDVQDDILEGFGCSASNPVTLVAEYRFDECLWDGTIGEVKDSSDNNYDGTAKNDLTTSSDGKIEISAYFDGVDDYIEQDDIYNTLKTTASLSFWIKTTQDGHDSSWVAPGVTGIEQRGGSDDVFWGWIDASGKIAINKGNQAGAKSVTTINDNNWYHIVLTRDSSAGETKVYVNGSLEDTVTDDDLTGEVSNSFNSIGRIKNTYGNNFEGYLDEVKIYDGVLSDSNVTTIYNNENSGKNYDGSDRDEISCGLCSAEPGYADSFEGSINDIQMVGDSIDIPKTFSVATMSQKTYKDNFVFSEPPVIFALPNTDGGNPASMRVKDVDSRGFKVAITEPQGEDGGHTNMELDYFAINQGVFELGGSFLEVGTVETKAVQKGYNISTNSWVTITPKVKFCNPVVLVQVQGMANEPNYKANNISKPFLSAVVDSSATDGTIKIALEMGDTNLGFPLTKNETIAYMIAESNIQSSFIDDADNNVKFETIKTGPIFYGWSDNSDVASANFVHNYTNKPLVAASINSRNSLDGGWFRKKDHNSDRIRLVVDEDRRTYRSGGSSQQDKERSKKKNGSDNTHTPEVGGIFVFEGKFIKNAKADIVSNFNAIDEGLGENETSLSTGYISTKIVDKSFKLDIIAREDDNSTLADANITKLEVVNCSDEACVDCKITNQAKDLSTANLNISETTGYATTSDLTVNEAYKLAKIRITGSSSSGEEITVCSSDLFSIRPNKFDFSLPSDAYASEEFNINFSALTATNPSITTPNYNEALNTSFTVESNLSKPECDIGTLSLDSFSFTDGVKNNVKAKYSNLGSLEVTIKENLGSEFAVVDKDDTNDSDRLIGSYTETIEIKPYDLNVTQAEMNSSTGEDWLYMANVDDMNVSLYATIGAYNKDGALLEDFNSTCYAKDVDLDFDLDTTGDSSLDMNYTVTDGIFSPTPTGLTLGDLDKTITISASNFVAGEADAGYALNVDRNFSSPVKPFRIQSMDISVATTTISKHVSGNSNNGSFKFYFGRASVDDIKTTKTTVDHFVEFEVFDPSNTLGFQQNSLNWSKNENHNNIKFGDITSSDVESEPNGVTASTFNLNSGKLTFTLSGSQSGTMHVDVDEWLWYVPFDCGSNCNYQSRGDGGNCKNHPCFDFTFKTTTKPEGVNTGDFGGSDYDTPSRGDYEKTGVKVFR